MVSFLWSQKKKDNTHKFQFFSALVQIKENIMYWIFYQGIVHMTKYIVFFPMEFTFVLFLYEF